MDLIEKYLGERAGVAKYSFFKVKNPDKVKKELKKAGVKFIETPKGIGIDDDDDTASRIIAKGL